MKTRTSTNPASQNDLQTSNGRAIKQEVLVGDGRVGGERARLRALLCLIGSGLVVRESQDGIVRNARDPVRNLASGSEGLTRAHLKVVVLRPLKKVFPKRRPLALSCLFVRMVKTALKPLRRTTCCRHHLDQRDRGCW
jgi:hypothetical protein